MSGSKVGIASLSDHRDLIDQVVRWHWHEWAEADSNASKTKWHAKVSERTNNDAVPFTLIAFLEQETVGCISVCLDDLDREFATRGPWISGLFVVPAARNLGVGRQLLTAAEERSVALGHDELWLHTAEATRFYERCGWELVRAKTGLQSDAVLRRTLASR